MNDSILASPADAGAARTLLPVVCVFGALDIRLQSSLAAPQYETAALDTHCFADDEGLEAIILNLRPHVFITFGQIETFGRLMSAPFEVRRRWLHYDAPTDLARVGSDAYNCYLSACIDARPEMPLVSVFTPLYRTGTRFLRPLHSLREQTYANWEWILWDDSDDDGETARMVRPYAENDHRIRLICPDRHSGRIGEVKYNACALSRGALLAELDHDDALTPDALQHLVAAAKEFPEAGFFYSDFAEVDRDLNPLRYPEGWGFGLGTYNIASYKGRDVAVAVVPGVSPKVIRHLVAAPNHLRAWRRSAYFAIGGHNRDLHVADDFELLIRTFLATAMVRIPRLGYIQFQDNASAQRVRNQDIQRHVRTLRERYDRLIHERFLALGIDDYVWDEAMGASDLSRPNPPIVPLASSVAGAV